MKHIFKKFQNSMNFYANGKTTIPTEIFLIQQFLPFGKIKMGL